MKKGYIRIKCIFPNNLNISNYYINIYDEYNKLISSSSFNKFGIFYFKILKSGIYKFIIRNKFFLKKKCIALYLNENSYKNITINFNNSLAIKKHPITFYLTDQNYKNLPIEKGRIILWKMKK